MTATRPSKKHLVCVLTVVVASVAVAAAGFFYMSLFASRKLVSPRLQNEPFYRSQEQLVADGVEAATLSRDQEEAMHRIIHAHYATAYRKEYEKRTEKLLSGGPDQDSKERRARELGSIDSAAALVRSYSQPRTYDGLRDIVGVFAAGDLFDDKLGRVRLSARLFLFRTDGETLQLEKALRVGEDVETCESAPVEYFKRESAR